MFEGVKKIFTTLQEDRELFEIRAKIYRASYETLIAEGFTEDQAMQIICAHPVIPNKGV